MIESENGAAEATPAAHSFYLLKKVLIVWTVACR